MLQNARVRPHAVIISWGEILTVVFLRRMFLRYSALVRAGGEKGGSCFLSGCDPRRMGHAVPRCYHGARETLERARKVRTDRLALCFAHPHSTCAAFTERAGVVCSLDGRPHAPPLLLVFPEFPGDFVKAAGLIPAQDCTVWLDELGK